MTIDAEADRLANIERRLGQLQAGQVRIGNDVSRLVRMEALLADLTALVAGGPLVTDPIQVGPLNLGEGARQDCGCPPSGHAEGCVTLKAA